MDLRTLRQQKLLVALLAGGLAGLAAYAALRDRAFRWAALDLKITRGEALERSRSFLESLGHDLSPFRRTSSFWSYEAPIIYLEKNLGTPETNRILRSGDLPVWGWYARFFRPLEKEEYAVWWAPDGSLAGFRHEILEEKEMPSLEPQAAERLAESFLASHFASLASGYELVERSSQARPRRTDFSFTWRAASAPLETRLFLRAVVSGDRITSFTRDIEVPESFRRAERETASRRALLSEVVGQVDLLLSVALVVFLWTAWRRGWLRFKPALLFASALFFLSALERANGFPGALYAYDTEDTLPAFWMSALWRPLLILAVVSAFHGFGFAAADAAGRTLPHAAYSLGDCLSGPFFRSSSFLTATLAGFGTAGVHLGYVTLFYMAGRHFLGAYSPLDVPYDNILSTVMPWVQPLLGGFAPALQEESLYRLFAIPVLMRFTKRRWLAVLLPAVLWGFLHTGYYVEPIYARGVELTLAGVFLGLVFLRFGIWATFVSHYVYNAALSSTLLLGSSSAYFRISSMAVIGLVGLPFAVASLRLLRKRGVQPHAGTPLVWEKSAPPSAVAADRRKAAKEPVLRLRIPLAISAAALSLLLLLPGAWKAPPIDLDRAQAETAAAAELDRLGHAPERFRRAAFLAEEPVPSLVSRYLRRHLSRRETRDYLRRFHPDTLRWEVRFFSPGTPQECSVEVGRRAEIFRLECRRGEDEAGAALTEERSRELAASFLSERGISAQALRYAGSEEEAYRHRKDLTHRWTDAAADVGELRRFVAVGVSDGRIYSYRSYFKPPEGFARAQRGETFLSEIRKVVFFLLVLALAALALRAFFDPSVAGHLWSPFVAALSLAVTALEALSWANRWPDLWPDYDTAVEVRIFIFRELLSLAGNLLVTFVAAYILLFLFLRLAPQVFSRAPTEEELRGFGRSLPWRWRGGRGAFSWALAVFLLQLLIRGLFGLGSTEPAGVLEPARSAFSAFFPAAEALLTCPETLLAWAVLGLVVAAAWKYAGKRATAACVLLYLAVLAADPHGWLDSLESLLSWLVIAAVVFRVVGFHLPFYFWYAGLSAAAPFLPWIASPVPAMRRQALIVLLAFLALVAALFAGRRPRSRPPQVVPLPNP